MKHYWFFGIIIFWFILLNSFNRLIVPVSEQSKRWAFAAGKVPVYKGGEWIDKYLYYENFSECDSIENHWGDLQLKTVELIPWKETWTAHFADGQFFHTEAISDSVRLAPVDHTERFYLNGEYTSSIHDAARPVGWYGMSWQYSNLPSSVGIEYRSGNTHTPDFTWSSWTKPPMGKFLCAYTYGVGYTECISPLDNVPSAQYFQYRSVFTSTDSTQSISLDEIEVDYGIYAITGTVTSMAITPIDLQAWRSAIFTATVPSNTAITVDVLAADGTVLFSDITSGENISGINSQKYPAIKLRAKFNTNDVSLSPVLYAWGLYWDVYHRVYFPFVNK